MIARDMDKNPYSADEARVAKFLFDLGAGGGDDPIGFMLASHAHLAAERNALREELAEWKQAASVEAGLRRELQGAENVGSTTRDKRAPPLGDDVP